MRLHMLFYTLFFLVFGSGLKSQVSLYSTDSIHSVDSAHDNTVKIRMVIDRSTDSLNKDSTYVFYINDFFNHHSTKIADLKHCVYYPLLIFAGNKADKMKVGKIQNSYYSQTIEKLVRHEYRKLVFRFGKSKIKRLIVKSGEKKEFVITLSVPELLSYHDHYKTDSPVKDKFFVFISYDLHYNTTPYFIALERYDTKTKKMIAAYKKNLECNKIGVVFK